jgi:hypothetical protein
LPGGKQLDPQEAAELLTVLERGYQRSYQAARTAWRTPEHNSRLQKVSGND